MKKTLRFPLAVLTVCALFLWGLQTVGLTFVKVQGPSMIPSYTDGQVLFVNRLAYGLQGPIIGAYVWIWKAPIVGDVVVVKKPDSGQWVVKRVAAVPGTALQIENHSLVIGSRRVPVDPSQEYWLESCHAVPDGCLFVLGDNLGRSEDSRDWGFVAISDIVGRPFL